MRPGKAILFGVIGAAAISLVSAVMRAGGVATFSIEIFLGTLTGMQPTAVPRSRSASCCT